MCKVRQHWVLKQWDKQASGKMFVTLQDGSGILSPRWHEGRDVGRESGHTE